MYRIKAVLKSPLMIGGKTLNSNYRESRDYIPGSVLRAAYAKALIERCACRQENYWLTYRGEEACEKCEFQTVCKNFAQITFPTLYPFGSMPYPVTAREKKYKARGEKSVLDILKCRLCRDGRMEEEAGWKRLEGFNREGAPVKLIHSTITRTAIDYRRNASKMASLYTQNVIAEQYMDENHKLADVEFSGEIRLSPGEEKLAQIPVLHIGANITSGFGICHMSYEEGIEEDTPEKIEKRIREFNSGIDGEAQYMVLDLITDAYLGLEEIARDALSQTEVSDKQMMEFLEKKLGLPADKYRLWKAYKFQELLRGFDTSKPAEKEMQRQGRLIVKAGAVFVYQILSKEIDTKGLLELEERGVGRNTEHGFGKLRICDSFHVKYDARKGEGRNGSGIEACN